MPLSEFEIKRCEKLVAEFIQKRRPPPHLRAEVDLAFRISGQSIEIFELRPDWRDKGKTPEQPFAKATYNKSKLNWKVLVAACRSKMAQLSADASRGIG
jgi:hypothetical protein